MTRYRLQVREEGGNDEEGGRIWGNDVRSERGKNRHP